MANIIGTVLKIEDVKITRLESGMVLISLIFDNGQMLSRTCDYDDVEKILDELEASIQKHRIYEA